MYMYLQIYYMYCTVYDTQYLNISHSERLSLHIIGHVDVNILMYYGNPKFQTISQAGS